MNCENNKCKFGTGTTTWCDDNRVCRSLNCDLSVRQCFQYGKLAAYEKCDFNEACKSGNCSASFKKCVPGMHM